MVSVDARRREDETRQNETHNQVGDVESNKKLGVKIESGDLLGEVLEEGLDSGPEVCERRGGWQEVSSRFELLSLDEMRGTGCSHLEWKGTSIPGRGMVAAQTENKR